MMNAFPSRFVTHSCKKKSHGLYHELGQDLVDRFKVRDTKRGETFISVV
jgi:hypothetical protein